MRAPSDPSALAQSLTPLNASEAVPVSGMARARGAAVSAHATQVESIRDEEQVPSTKPSIVPGPSADSDATVQTTPTVRGGVVYRIVAYGPRLAIPIGLVLVALAVVMERWGQTFGVLCGALGGAVIVFGLLVKGSSRSL